MYNVQYIMCIVDIHVHVKKCTCRCTMYMYIHVHMYIHTLQCTLVARFHCNYRYRVFSIEDPYVSYGIKVVVQQHFIVFNTTTKKEEVQWITVGETVVGPQVRGGLLKDRELKDSPEV